MVPELALTFVRVNTDIAEVVGTVVGKQLACAKVKVFDTEHNQH